MLDDRETEPELYRLRRENARLRAELEAAKRSAVDLHNRIRDAYDDQQEWCGVYVVPASRIRALLLATEGGA